MMMRFLRIAARYFIYLVAVLVVLAAGATVVLTLTEGGRATLASTVSGLASGPGRTVRVDGLDGIWSGHLTIADVVVEDENGPWARLTGITLDWSPLALVGFAFDAEKIIVERVEIERPPKAADTEPGGPFALPVTIDVAELELQDIRLGQALAGVAARLSATGSLVIDNSPLAFTANLAVDRIDERAGSLSAKIAFVPSKNRLELDVNGSEPEGGLIASMLRLPGVPPVEIGVSGSGDAADWRGKATFTVDGDVAASIEGRHQLTDSGSRIEATGTGNFHPFLPDGFADIAQGETRFSVAGIVRPWNAASVEQLSLRSATVEVNASGSLDPERVSDFQLSARATGDPVIISYGEAAARTTARLRALTARAFGPGEALSFTVNADLARFESAGVAAEDIVVSARSDAFDLPARRGPVDMSVRSDAAGSVTPILANLLAGQVSLEARSVVSPEAVLLESVAVKSGTVTAQAKGQYGVGDQSLALDFSGDMLSAVLPASARPFLDRSMALSGRAERSADGTLSLSGAEARSGNLSVSGGASLNGGEIEADITGAFGDLSLLSAASGQASFALQASGELNRPKLTAIVSSDSLLVAGREITGLALDAEITADRTAPQGEITLTGRVGQDVLEGKAVLKSGDGRREVGDLALSLGENRLTGALTLDAGLAPDGTIEFDFPDFGGLAALALVDVSGAAVGTVDFTRQDGVPRLVIEARAPRLAMEAAQAAGISVSAIAENYLDAPVVSGQLQADSVIARGVDIRNARIDLSRDGAWTSFDGAATANGTPATATGRVQVENGDVTLELEKAAATYRSIKASLAAPSTIVVRDGVTRLDGLKVNAAGGNATIAGTAGSDLDLRVGINVLPAAAINAFAPGLGADGTVAGSAEIKGKASNPEIAYDLKWTGGRTAQTRAAGLGAMNVASKGTYSGGTVRFDATVGAGSGLTMRGGGSVDVPARSLDVSFDGQVPFGFLASRLAAQGVALNGAASVALKIGGGFAAPQVSGTVRTSQARLIHAPSGVAIDDLAAVIDLGGGAATVSSMRGRLSTGGEISGGGTIGIEPAGGFPADLNFTIENGRYTDGRIVTANFDGVLTLNGPVTNNPVLGGRINLGRTVVTIPDGLPPSLSQLDVEHRNAPAAVTRQQEALRPSTGGSGGGGGLSLDLDISAPREIIVQGRGLDAELGGNLKLTGPARSVSALGQFDLRRGRLEFLGRRLDFRRGTLGFSGSLIPYLNFAADTRAEDATVTVLITGPANNPAFSFESTPILPEDEILARLLFGKAMSGLSPVQIAQLASAAAQLAGIGGSTTLLQRLRERVGVDDIDVRTDAETGDTSVSVGKYLNDRTYLSIEKGSQPGSGKAIIDLDVGGGVKLRGEASDSGATSGGIFYEKEY